MCHDACLMHIICVTRSGSESCSFCNSLVFSEFLPCMPCVLLEMLDSQLLEVFLTHWAMPFVDISVYVLVLFFFLLQAGGHPLSRRAW